MGNPVLRRRTSPLDPADIATPAVQRLIDDMFETGHDAANRAAVKNRDPEDMKIAGLALQDDRKLVDKITKGAKLRS